MRLKVDRDAKAFVEEEFQFYDSAIKSQGTIKGPVTIVTFQFYDSAIKSVCVCSLIMLVFVFQFYDSAIKSMLTNEECVNHISRFNSTIVRLKGC